MSGFFYRVFGIGALALIAANGCGSSYSDTCKPGKMVACTCENGAKGSQSCTKEDACDCGSANSTDVGDTGFGSPEGTSDPPNDPPPEADGGVTPGTDGGTTPAGDAGVVEEGDDAGPTPTGDAGSIVSADPDAPAPTCAKLENTGKRIMTTNVIDDAPKALGGTITPGTYVQTWLVHYRGADASAPEKVLRSSQTIEVLEDGTGRFTRQENEKAAQSAGIVFRTVGAAMTVEPVCPPGPSATFNYSASARQLVIFDPPWARYFELQAKPVAPESEETPSGDNGEGQ